MHVLSKRPRKIYTSVGLILIVVVMLTLSQLPPTAQAQDGQNLPWGEVALGAVTGPEGALFNFDGAAGDAASVEVVGIGGFIPAVRFLDINRAVVAQEDNLGGTPEIQLSYTLAGNGFHYVQVVGVNNSIGQFTIVLNRGLPPGIPLAIDTPTQGVVSNDFRSIYYDFNLDPAANTSIQIRSLTQDYSPVATIYSPGGDPLATLTSQQLVAASFEFGPGTDTLKLMVDLGSFQGQANFEVLYGRPGSSSGSSDPVATQEVSGSSDLCVLSSTDGNDVRIRTGGSTNHPIIGALPGNGTIAAIGYNSANGGWYQVRLDDGTVGWMASFVLNTSGPCSNLPTQTYAAAPSGGGGGGGGDTGGGSGDPGATEEPGPSPSATTPAPEATEEGGGGGAPPPTTPPPTATTPPPPPTAPPDNDPVANLELNFKQNESATLSDYISYPNGDTSDQVIYEVVGFDSVTFQGESTITFVCTGPGSDQALVKFTGTGIGQPCNGLSRTFTHGEYTATQRFWVYLESGSDAYVQWTAVITTRRP